MNASFVSPAAAANAELRLREDRVAVVGLLMSKEKENFWKAWDERLAALRQIPPVLKIVWESGRGVVTGGIIVRIITALLPIALLAVSKRIIDNIVNVVERHQPISRTFWWLVATEFALAVLGTVLTRLLDYTDSLLPTNTPATSASRSCATRRSSI